ncbi:hypothetical protein FKM82_013276 [Ascaphus truei]
MICTHIAVAPASDGKQKLHKKEAIELPCSTKTLVFGHLRSFHNLGFIFLLICYCIPKIIIIIIIMAIDKIVFWQIFFLKIWDLKDFRLL